MKVPYVLNELGVFKTRLKEERRHEQETEVDGRMENPYVDAAMATLEEAMTRIRILCHQELLANALSKLTQRKS